MAMTAPVVQREGGRPGSHIVGFVMPADETLETLPEPDDLGVTLRAVPVEFAAALRYSGRWTQAGYEEGAARLQRAIADTGLRAIGQPQWARFDPPVDALVSAPQRGGCSRRGSGAPLIRSTDLASGLMAADRSCPDRADGRV